MQYIPNVQTSKISNVQPGTCVSFDYNQKTYIAIAVEPPSGDLPSLAVVSPGHPQLNGKAGIYFGSVVQGHPLLVYPEAKIILPKEPEHVHIGFNSFNKPPGALFLEGNTLGLAAFDGQEVTVFNVDTGAVLSGNFYQTAWFSAWEIAVPGFNGEKQTICRVTCDVPAQ